MNRLRTAHPPVHHPIYTPNTRYLEAELWSEILWLIGVHGRCINSSTTSRSSKPRRIHPRRLQKKTNLKNADLSDKLWLSNPRAVARSTAAIPRLPDNPYIDHTRLRPLSLHPAPTAQSKHITATVLRPILSTCLQTSTSRRASSVTALDH